MDRRDFLALLSTPALVALLQSCGSDDDPTAGSGTIPTIGGSDTTPRTSPASTAPATSAASTTPGTTAGPADQIGEARSDLARRVTTIDEARDGATSINELSRDLRRVLAAARPTDNLVFSPVSIAVALSMTAAGARGETLEEMLATLHVPDPARAHAGANAVTAELEGRSGADVELSFANSVWAQLGLGFEQAFLDLLATEYGAGLSLVDYRADPEAARIAINQWVDDETRGRIPQLLAEGVITVDSRLTLVNAIYVKAAWLNQFAKDMTPDIEFATAGGASKPVPAMSMTRSFLYGSADGWKAIELPYTGEQLAMAIVLPDQGRLAELEQGLAFADVLGALQPGRVHLTLPKFEIDASHSLADTLEALGMGLAFTDGADFSGISTDELLKIAAVVHQANISVDEYGTEAAASTAVIMEPTSAPVGEPVELVLDRPFLFVVYDRVTGTSIFVGRVADPTG